MPTYIVANPKYWASIPSDRELTCGRVRFTESRIPAPEGAGGYSHKAEAVREALASGHDLVRETQTSEHSWHYQLLLQGVQDV